MDVRKFKKDWEGTMVKRDWVHIHGGCEKGTVLIRADEYRIDYRSRLVELYFNKQLMGWIKLSLITEVE